MHRDTVFGFPPEARPLGATAKCQNQGMYVMNRYITVQGHPEFTPAIVEEILESRQKIGVFPDGVFEDGMKRLTDRHDGVLVAVVFLKFLLDD
jgi:GMP synthase-like glutamine amidotransferase